MAFWAIGLSWMIRYMGDFDVLTAEYGCDAHVVTSSCYLPCGATVIIHNLNLLSIDCTAVWANRPGPTNT